MRRAGNWEGRLHTEETKAKISASRKANIGAAAGMSMDPVFDRRESMPEGLSQKQYGIWLTYRQHVHPAALRQMIMDAA